MRENGYSKTVPTILTSIDVLESSEFKKWRFIENMIYWIGLLIIWIVAAPTSRVFIVL